ncbi:hypothetical protein K2173_016203 [Erythroxylum novogranatense]|uniref:Uncharacterized protein n=1 Tax=Erythroxylum novogranatense TaxID=1862640 RepID=A0AAV8SFQ5_9ROSI|nr:hypothetical protein K2173_016203 [Erythroxylum novogranatense]
MLDNCQFVEFQIFFWSNDTGGQLGIIFSHDLKILSWEFCAWRHEELFPRRVVAPQVNQFVQVAQKCQSMIAETRTDGVSQQDLQTNSNMVLTTGRQLSRSLELRSLNDLGFSKRYVRCLQGVKPASLNKSKEKGRFYKSLHKKVLGSVTEVSDIDAIIEQAEEANPLFSLQHLAPNLPISILANLVEMEWF